MSDCADVNELAESAYKFYISYAIILYVPSAVGAWTWTGAVDSDAIVIN